MTPYAFTIAALTTALAAWTPGVNGLEVVAIAAIWWLVVVARDEETDTV